MNEADNPASRPLIAEASQASRSREVPPADGGLSRAVGIETEYGVASAHVRPVDDGTRPPLTPEESVNEIFRHTPQRHRSAHHFLSNGARLYVDIGSHPEYAGPECRTLADVIAQDRAGDLILARMVDIANASLAERADGKNPARIHLMKSNADAHGNTFGCHENYQVPRAGDFPVAGFVGFLAARQILTGSGRLTARDARDTDAAAASPLGPMRYSARAAYMVASTSADPTAQRAFINTRDEPHADRSRWRRLHVLAGDSAVCEAGTALKVALGDAVLAMAETGAWDLAECTLADPVEATNRWNVDPRAALERDGGGTITCVDILGEVLERIDAFWSRAGLRPDALTARAYDLARRGLTALASGDASGVDRELDWAIKHRVLSHVADAAPGGWADPRVARTELAYHDISARSGLAAGLRRAGLMASWITDEDIERATTTPPAGTRAAIRGPFVQACERMGRLASIGWAHVRLDRPARPQIDLPDPLAFDSAEVRDLVEEIYRLGPSGPEPEPPSPAPTKAVPRPRRA
ncbi:MAG: proteasome accessory factor PafA2 family protein [Bowdeniella nasicola]|nr:proteasome accessory factor PafA2 family protein [Bowdeniella nasicola]